MKTDISKRSVLAGALVGMTALAGSIVGLAAIAGAQDGDEPPTTSSPLETDAWAPFEDCIDNHLGGLEDPWVEGEEPSETDLDTFDAAWEAADEACDDLLPAEAKADIAAWAAFDECLDESGVFDDTDFDDSDFDDGEFDTGTVVYVETPDGFQAVEFGDTEGSVTITGTADGVTLTSTGGVTVFDEAALDAEWAELDAAHEACEPLLPDDAFDEFDFDDMDFDETDLEDAEG